MKNLPPIFKVSNNISSNNTSYYKSSSVAKMPVIKQKEEEEQASIEDKINAIFRTTVNTFLAARTSSSIITLDNEIIPIATITSLKIKKAHQS
jgi:hypothetical protein